MNQLKKSSKERSVFSYMMTSPAVVFLLIMTAYPFIFTIVYSFTDYNFLSGSHPFNGLDNYLSLLRNNYFRQAVWNTVKFTALAVFFEVVIGMVLAVFVKSLSKGQKAMRTIILLPYLLPAMTVALIWRMMLSPNYGIINQIISSMGFNVYNWFYDAKTAFNTILLIDVWQNVPFAFLLIYAHLQTVPDSQYEAASIDGANVMQRFIHITWPNISGGVAFCAMMRTIDTFRLFEKVNILTGGGPANSTSTITQFMYSYGIKTLKFGFASSCAIIMTILVLILSSVYIKKAMKE